MKKIHSIDSTQNNFSSVSTLKFNSKNFLFSIQMNERLKNYNIT